MKISRYFQLFLIFLFWKLEHKWITAVIDLKKWIISFFFRQSHEILIISRIICKHLCSNAFVAIKSRWIYSCLIWSTDVEWNLIVNLSMWLTRLSLFCISSFQISSLLPWSIVREIHQAWKPSHQTNDFDWTCFMSTVTTHIYK